MFPSIRERVSDTLLRTGTELAFDRRDLERSIDGASGETPGYAAAQQAVWLARRVETAVLWLGWRLRPRPFAVGPAALIRLRHPAPPGLRSRGQ